MRLTYAFIALTYAISGVAAIAAGESAGHDSVMQLDKRLVGPGLSSSTKAQPKPKAPPVAGDSIKPGTIQPQSASNDAATKPAHSSKKAASKKKTSTKHQSKGKKSSAKHKTDKREPHTDKKKEHHKAGAAHKEHKSAASVVPAKAKAQHVQRMHTEHGASPAKEFVTNSNAAWRRHGHGGMEKKKGGAKKQKFHPASPATHGPAQKPAHDWASQANTAW
ncbi:hypothetical protein OC845_004970 [Tilletia horrida]|nr:hypothetical protein OC845_004970 [Tilletia horrida]